jgi:hypothetical protein
VNEESSSRCPAIANGDDEMDSDWITPEIKRGWQLEAEFRRRHLTVLAVVPGSEPGSFVAYLADFDVPSRVLWVRGVASVRPGVARTIREIWSDVS